MKSLGYIVWIMVILACNSNDQPQPEEEENSAFSFENFSARFKEVNLPYQLSDTSLLNNKDTSGIRNAAFAAMIPDSIKQKLVGTSTGIKLVPLARFKAPDAEHYFIIKPSIGRGQWRTARLRTSS